MADSALAIKLLEAQRAYDEAAARFRVQKEANGFPFLGGVPTSLAEAQRHLADVKRRIADEQQRETTGLARTTREQTS